jgi:hypothetical protein
MVTSTRVSSVDYRKPTSETQITGNPMDAKLARRYHEQGIHV